MPSFLKCAPDQPFLKRQPLCLHSLWQSWDHGPEDKQSLLPLMTGARVTAGTWSAGPLTLANLGCCQVSACAMNVGPCSFKIRANDRRLHIMYFDFGALAESRPYPVKSSRSALRILGRGPSLRVPIAHVCEPAIVRGTGRDLFSRGSYEDTTSIRIRLELQAAGACGANTSRNHRCGCLAGGSKGKFKG